MYEVKDNHDKKSNRAVLILLLFLLTVFLMTMKFHGLLLKGHAQNFEEIKTSKKIYAKKDPEESVKIYEDGYLIEDKKGIAYYNFDGQRLWKKELSKMQQVITSEDRIYLVDNFEDFVKAVDHKGQTIWTYEVGGRVKSVYENDGYTFIVSGTEKSWLHSINDEGGIVVHQLLLPDNFLKGYIDQQMSTLALTYLDVKEEEIISNLQVYSFDREKLWEEFFEGEIIQKMISTPGNTMLLLTDKRLLAFENDQLIWERGIDGTVIDLKLENNRIYLLLKDEKNYIDVINLKGKVTLHYVLQEDYNKISVVDNQIYIGSGGGVLQINHKGEKEALYLCQEDMVSFQVTNLGVLCLTKMDVRGLSNKDL